MGQPIGSRYELDEQLGRGAFGSVWRGRVRDTGEAVAVKVLLEELATDADVVTRFLRERTALVGLRHRSLVSVRDLVVEGDVLALVMQLVDGPDLRAYLRARGTLGAEEAALLVADVADALAVAHAANIIHRDVKPANVLLQPEAGGFRPLLTDFGIARLADAPSVTRTSQVVGTPYYLSPEVISGRKATAAVDVYASGIMLYELLTGRPPFRGRDAMEVFRAHQVDTPQRPPGVSDRLWAVATAALAKDPQSRPLAGELGSRLRAAVKVKQDGTTVRLPVNLSEGTVVLPALDAEAKIAAAAGAGAHAAPHAVWPSRQAQQKQLPAGAVNASAEPGAPQQKPAEVIPINRAAQIAPTTPIARLPLAQPQASQQPVSQQPVSKQPVSQPPAAAQAAAANGSAAAPLRPPAASPGAPVYPSGPAYPSASPAQNRQPHSQPHSQPQPHAQAQPPVARPYGAPQQSNPYPMAYQQAPRPVQPGPYRPPQQQTYQAARSKAPRQPQTYSPNAPTKNSGLGCLSKLALLVIVLAVAIAVGVTVGRQLAKHHTAFSNRPSGTSVMQSGYQPVALVELRAQ